MSISAAKKITNENIRLIACVLSGFFSSLPFFASELFFLEWISLVPFFLIIIQKDSKIRSGHLFLYGFINHFVKSVIVLSWFKELSSMAALDFSPMIMNGIIVLANVGISAVLSVPMGICTMIFGVILKYGKSALINSMCISVFYTLFELLNSVVEKHQPFGLVGFPWVVTYITQQNFIPGIQSASLFGAHFITFVIIFVNCTIAYAFLSKGALRKYLIFAAVILFSANLAFGLAEIQGNDKGENSGKTAVACVYQDNCSSYDKWSLSPIDTCDSFIADMEKYFESNQIPDFILLSETIFTVELSNGSSQYGTAGNYIVNRLCEFSEKYGIVVMCGGFYNENQKKYNALFAFDKGIMSDTVYKKRTLVPFGEYVPAEEILYKVLPMLENFNLSGSSLASGEATEIIDTSAGKAGGLICYDSIFFYNALQSSRDGAEYLVLSTNDSWYNDSAAAYQHYAHAVFRAIENRKSVIRCATTGISGIIDSKGRTLASTGLLNKDIISAEFTQNTDISFFAQHGYTYLYLLTLLSVCYIIFSAFYGRKKEGK